MTLSVSNALNMLQGHAQALGVFDDVLKHEPKSAPPQGLTYGIWLEDISPYVQHSGLNKTSVRVVFRGRIMTLAEREPQDQVETDVATAVDRLLEAYTGDFTLGDQVRNVDLLGMSGQTLSGTAGYVAFENVVYRSFDIIIPLIMKEEWSQNG